MGLDLYVMPLWRFKVGDFLTPVEAALGGRSRVVTPDGVQERGRPITPAARARARREVADICREVQAANRVRVHWEDKGDVVFAEQSQGIEPLRAYARWLDLRQQLPRFDRPPDGNYYKHPAMALKPPGLSCPHLVEHDCYSGYFLPCEFEQLVRVEPYEVAGRWRFLKAVGSTPRLLRELALVQKHLDTPDDYAYRSQDPLGEVKVAYLQMRKAAELSARHRLPIIFWG